MLEKDLNLSKNQIARIVALISFVIFIFLIRNVLFPIVISILLYYMLDPLVQKLLKLGVNKILAIVMAFLVFILVLFIGLLFIFPPLIDEFSVLLANVPGYLSQAEGLLNSLQSWQTRIDLPKEVDGFILGILQNVFNIISIFAQQSLNAAIGTISRFIYLIIIPLMTFFMLKDDVLLAKGFIEYLPQAHRKIATRTLKQIDQVLKNYIVGQAILCTIVGVLVGLGLAILGIKFALILGIVAAISQLIPNIGPFIGAAPALIIAVIMSPMQALGVLIFFVLLNILVIAVLAPKILGDKLNLHPLTIVLSVLVWGEIAGVWGLFLAAPIVAILKILYLELWDPT
jgi:predicted PurR-regulated permease PerM